MTCAEFQKVLPYIIDSGGNAEEQEHLRQCDVCSDLVSDLKYIADQAKLLVPMMEPNARVWDGIKDSLQREGMVKPGSARGRLLAPSPSTRWGPAWALPVAAVVLLAAVLFLYRQNSNSGSNATAQQSVSPSTLALVDSQSVDDTHDQEMLTELSAHDPDLRSSYEEGLRSVNSYIADAQQSVSLDPDDADARAALMEAYQEKAMLYDMAMQHSLQ